MVITPEALQLPTLQTVDIICSMLLHLAVLRLPNDTLRIASKRDENHTKRAPLRARVEKFRIHQAPCSGNLVLVISLALNHHHCVYESFEQTILQNGLRTALFKLRQGLHGDYGQHDTKDPFEF